MRRPDVPTEAAVLGYRRLRAATQQRAQAVAISGCLGHPLPSLRSLGSGGLFGFRALRFFARLGIGRWQLASQPCELGSICASLELGLLTGSPASPRDVTDVQAPNPIQPNAPSTHPHTCVSCVASESPQPRLRELEGLARPQGPPRHPTTHPLPRHQHQHQHHRQHRRQHRQRGLWQASVVDP